MGRDRHVQPDFDEFADFLVFICNPPHSTQRFRKSNRKFWRHLVVKNLNPKLKFWSISRLILSISMYDRIMSVRQLQKLDGRSRFGRKNLEKLKFEIFTLKDIKLERAVVIF